MILMGKRDSRKMKMKIRNNSKMWVYLLSLILIFYYRQKLVSYAKKGWRIGKIVFREFIYNMAESYGFSTGGKREIKDDCNLARITYKNLRNETCCVSVPFMKSTVRCMRDKIVVLETLENSRPTYRNITQEPGMAYTMSPKEMGGVRIHVYQAEKGWNDKDFTVPDKALLIVEGNERLPWIMPFTKDKEVVDI